LPNILRHILKNAGEGLKRRNSTAFLCYGSPTGC
jgi:hypothetical protein